MAWPKILMEPKYILFELALANLTAAPDYLQLIRFLDDKRAYHVLLTWLMEFGGSSYEV
jgi:hypothetical protein